MTDVYFLCILSLAVISTCAAKKNLRKRKGLYIQYIHNKCLEFIFDSARGYYGPGKGTLYVLGKQH